MYRISNSVNEIQHISQALFKSSANLLTPKARKKVIFQVKKRCRIHENVLAVFDRECKGRNERFVNSDLGAPQFLRKFIFLFIRFLCTCIKCLSSYKQQFVYCPLHVIFEVVMGGKPSKILDIYWQIEEYKIGGVMYVD